jgi:hypothetical protein
VRYWLQLIKTLIFEYFQIMQRTRRTPGAPRTSLAVLLLGVCALSTPAAAGAADPAPAPPNLGPLDDVDNLNLALFRESDCAGLVAHRASIEQRARDEDQELVNARDSLNKDSKKEKYVQIRQETAAMFQRSLDLLEFVRGEKRCTGVAQPGRSAEAPGAPRVSPEQPAAALSLRPGVASTGVTTATPGQPAEDWYCFFRIENLDEQTGYMTQPYGLASGKLSEPQLTQDLLRFVRHMQVTQPGRWNDDLAAIDCSGARGEAFWQCSKPSIRSFFGDTQIVMAACVPGAKQAQAYQQRLRAGQPLQMHQALDYRP